VPTLKPLAHYQLLLRYMGQPYYCPSCQIDLYTNPHAQWTTHHGHSRVTVTCDCRRPLRLSRTIATIEADFANWVTSQSLGGPTLRRLLSQL
jgi:hypothetical protein